MMTTWYSIEIDSSNSGQKTLQRIMDGFTPKYVGAGRPVEMAIFTSPSADGLTVYFSPKAVSLAIQFGASSCDRDFINQDLSLLVGDPKSIEILFPEAISQ